jgi:hypothetical protein
MDVELLLSEVAAISKKYDLLYQKTGGYFNIFEIANIATDEVRVCRVLYELLSPNGSHYQKHAYLKLFAENVLKIDMSEDELKTAEVYREKSTKQDKKDKRMDLVIKTKTRVIPIEVKIYAGEQKKQCYDYYQEAINSNLFYLTPEGQPPTEYSANGLTKNKDGNGYQEVTNISFRDDILNWLDLCLAQKETIKITPIREVFQQFAASIRRFTNQMEEDKKMEVQKVIMKSPENMKNAIEIESALKTTKIEMMKKLFCAIDERVGGTRVDNEFDYVFKGKNNRMDIFYDAQRTTNPGITYLLKKGIKLGVDLWIRIEIDNKLFISYCCFSKEKQVLSRAEIDRLFKKQIRIEKNVLDKTPDWLKYKWLYWEYIPNDVQTPDFKSFNTAYYDLFDATKFNEIVDACVTKYNEFSAVNI